jgi:dihydroflavonol-4-reductase
MKLPEMATVLKSRLGAAADRVPTRVLPNWLVRLAARFDPSLGDVVNRLGHTMNASNEKARHVLDWKPRSPEDSLVATATSLIDLGLVPAKSRWPEHRRLSTTGEK